MKRSLLFLSLLLLGALALCLAACGEGEPAETSNAPTTSNGTTTLSAPEATTVTTAAATTIIEALMPYPFEFYLLSDFYLYMEENPKDPNAYEIVTWVPGNRPCEARLIRIEEFLPTLYESADYQFSVVKGLNYDYGIDFGIQYAYGYKNAEANSFLNIRVEVLEEFAYPCNRNGETYEWNEELKCLLMKTDGELYQVVFYALDGYRVTIRLEEPEHAMLLASDVTEVREIWENPTFSCERLRIISETLRAMNEE